MAVAVAKLVRFDAPVVGELDHRPLRLILKAHEGQRELALRVIMAAQETHSEHLGVEGDGAVEIDPESRYSSIYEFLDETIAGVAPGSDGIIFAPWLRGSRSPFEDPNARGIFFNVGVDTGKSSLVRAVSEGIALQCRWQLEAIRRKVPAHGPLRFVGGGARSKSMATILADATGEVVEVPQDPQNAGALGAAMLCAAGLGLVPSVEAAASLVPVARRIEPTAGNRAVYDNHYAALRRLYYSNRATFGLLNEARGS